ncbi:MAG: hypothetical protein ABIF01_01490, partial [Candidatus Micrarchaeota archaeon]
FMKDSIPFETDQLAVLGVNKNGDASLVYAGKPVVLSAGGHVAFEKDSKVDVFGNCTLSVKETVVIRDYGFIREPGER